MANIDRIVNVQIALGTTAITQNSFSDLMILIPGAWAFRVGIITSADDLITAPYSILSTSPGYLAAQNAFSQNPTLTRLYIGRVDGADATPAITMAAIVAENNAWYAFGEAARTVAKATGYAAWAEANKKLFFVGVTGDDGVQGTLTDVAGTLYTAKYFRSIALHYNAAGDYGEFGWAAKRLASLPGSETWANTTLAGLTGGNLTETQFANIKFRNSNSYEVFRNIAITQNGKTSGGEWIDIIRGRDWQEEEIRTNVLNQFIDRRIPFTDSGIRIIKSALIASLDLGQRRGFIAPDSVAADGKTIVPGYKVFVPFARDVSTSDKAARMLRDITFRATVSGAIHATEIRGTLVYDAA